MTLLDRILLLVTGLVAIYLLYRFWMRYSKGKGLHDVYYMMGFAVLLISCCSSVSFCACSALPCAAKAAIVDDWCAISAVDNTPVGYTRYTCTLSSGSTGTFRAGTSVSDYGQAAETAGGDRSRQHA